MNFTPMGDQIAPVVIDSDQYPDTWEDYLGQVAAKKVLRRAIKSAQLRGEVLDHILIAHGTGGMGKTALAVLVGRMLGVEVRVASGQIDAMQARMILARMHDGDVLFIDEIHQMMDGGKKKAEWLLTYMTDCLIPGPLGMEKMPRVTIIGATTDVGRLPETIVSRFPIQPLMVDYTVEEAAQMATTMSRVDLCKHGLPELGHDNAMEIATAGNHNPRAMRNLIKAVRDLALVEEMEVLDGLYDIPMMLADEGITHDGLDYVAQRYLLVLASEFNGKAGARNIEDRLQQPGGLRATERVLMDKGLIVKTRSGREITTAGINRLCELAEESAA